MCSLVAFGGPEAHLGVFLERLVKKNKYLTEKSLMEWMALCSFLPGPTSTQVITGIGLEKGGRRLASLTLLVWAMPMITVMGALSFLPYGLGSDGRWPDWLSFLVPMAGGFIAWATWQEGSFRFIDAGTVGAGICSRTFGQLSLGHSPNPCVRRAIGGDFGKGSGKRGRLRIFTDTNSMGSFHTVCCIGWNEYDCSSVFD